MSGSPKEKLGVVGTEGQTEEVSDTREVYLRDGRKLVLSEQGGDQLVEVRSESGMLEVRIKLTEQGPVLQMETVRMQLKASEAVEIASPRVEITATEQLALSGGEVKVTAEEEVQVESNGDVRVTGKMIWLN
jgi:phage gp45-like